MKRAAVRTGTAVAPRPLRWLVAVGGIGVVGTGLALLITGYDESKTLECSLGPGTLPLCRSAQSHEAVGVLVLLVGILVAVFALSRELRFLSAWKVVTAGFFGIAAAVSLGIGLWLLVAAARHAGACATGTDTTVLVCTGGQVTGGAILAAAVGFLAVVLGVLASDGRAPLGARSEPLDARRGL